MSAGESLTRDNLDAALKAISRFDELNAEAARVLQQVENKDNRDGSTTASDTVEHHGAEAEILSAGDDTRFNDDERERFKEIENGDFHDEGWSYTDSDGQESDIVKNVLANATKSVLQQVGDQEISERSDQLPVHPHTSSYDSGSPQSSSPTCDVKKQLVDVQENNSFGQGNGDVSVHSDETPSDTESEVSSRHFEENKDLSGNLKTLREQFEQDFLDNAGQLTEVAKREYFFSEGPDSGSDTSENDNEHDTTFIQDGVQVDPSTSFDNESETVGGAKSGETVEADDIGTRELDATQVSNQKESKDSFTSKGNEAVWKAPVPLIRSDTFTKEKTDSDFVPETQTEVPSSSDERPVWRAPRPLISMSSRETLQEMPPPAGGHVPLTEEKASDLKTPTRISEEKLESSERKSPVEEEEQESGRWKAPHPMVSRDSFPHPSEKDIANEIKMKFAVQAAESEFPEVNRTETKGLVDTRHPANERDNVSVEGSESVVSEDQMPSMDELLTRFQRLRSEDDLTHHVTIGSNMVEEGFRKEFSDNAETSEVTLAEFNASHGKQDESLVVDKDIEPETSESTGEPTEKSDIFSTGNMFYRGYIDVTSSDETGSEDERKREERSGGLFEGNVEDRAEERGIEDTLKEEETPPTPESKHDSDWLSDDDDYHESFVTDSESDSASDEIGDGEMEEEKEECVDEDGGRADNTEQTNGVQDNTLDAAQPTPNVSSDFKSSVDTSVWSASDDEIPVYAADEAGYPDNEHDERAVCDIEPEMPEPVTVANLLTQEETGEKGKSMFDVPPPRIAVPSISTEMSKMYHETKATESADQEGVVVKPQQNISVEDAGTGNDETEINNREVEQKRRKSRKSRRSGSIEHDHEKLSKDGPLSEGQVRRHRSRHKHDKVKGRLDEVRGEERVEGTGKNREVPLEEMAADPEASAMEEKRQKLSREKKTDRELSGIAQPSKEDDRELSGIAQPSKGDDRELSGIAQPSKEDDRVKHEEERKLTRPSSGGQNNVEVSADWKNNDRQESTKTDHSSEHQSRRRRRKPRVPKISDTLYHQQPLTNEDNLDEMYVELFNIMRSDGVEVKELVKEVGIVLARAGLSPRSPPTSHNPSPRVEKPKAKPKVEKFKPMPGVHVVPYDTHVPSDSFPAAVERRRVKRSNTAEDHRDSLEQTHKLLYRKYNELNCLLNRQLPQESEELIHEQLEQTLQLLHHYEKRGHFHVRPKREVGESDISSTNKHGSPMRSKSVTFSSESRPGSGRCGRSLRRKGRGKTKMDMSHFDSTVASDDSGSENRSRSRSRSYSPTDCDLRHSKNPSIRSWLREKNHQLRRQKRAERLKKIEEKRLHDEEMREREEKAKKSTRKVQMWLKEKRKESRLLSKREEDTRCKIKKGEGQATSTEEVETLVSSASKPMDNLRGAPVRTSDTKKRPVSAPDTSGNRTISSAPRGKPLSPSAANVIRSYKGSGSQTVAQSVNVVTCDSAVGSSVSETADGRSGAKSVKRPKSSKQMSKPVTEQESEKNELLKKRLSYDQWVKEKREQDKQRKQKEKEVEKERRQDSDPAVRTIIPDLARRRIRIIESNKIRVDSGIRSIDDDANSYPRALSRESETQQNVDESFSLSGETENVREAEERYQWRLEGEVPSPRSKSGKKPSPGSARSVPGGARPSSSPSRTRARARLTMPMSTTSPRKRVENISEKGPNPFRAPIPVVNASLKRSGDDKSHRGRQTWKGFSDEVWKQVNEEEGVGPFQLVVDAEGENDGEAGETPVEGDAAAVPNEDGYSVPSVGDSTAAVPDGDVTVPSVGDSTAEVPNADVSVPSVGDSTAAVPNGDVSVPSVGDCTEIRYGPEQDTAAVAENAAPSATSSPKVNFGGIFYTVDAHGVQHGIHEGPRIIGNAAAAAAADEGEIKTGSDVKETLSGRKVTDTEATDPRKKKVNFGGIIYEMDRKEESATSSEIEEELSDEVEDEDAADGGFFITNIEDDEK